MHTIFSINLSEIKLITFIKKSVIYLLFIAFSVGYSKPTNSIVPINAPTEDIVVCYNDLWGVPYITAKSENDAFFVQGYVTARDRFFQLDATRRKYQGRLTEIAGWEYLDSDLEALRLNYSAVAAETMKVLSPNTIDILEAYSNGINYYLDTHLFSCVELAIGPKPDRWKPEDCIGIGLLTNWTMSEDFYVTQDWQKIRIALNNEKFLELFSNDVHGVTSQLKATDNYQQNLSPKYKEYIDKIVYSSPILQKEKLIGSNCIVVSGSRTTTGKPLIFNDPHLDIFYPSIWYEVDIAVQGLWHNHGVSIPGVPGIIIGANQYLGWGVTLQGADQTDVYQFPVNPQNPNQYQYNNQWYDFTTENYTLSVRKIGKEKNQTHKTEIKRTIFGPVFFEDQQNKFVQVVRWVALEPTYDFEAFIKMMRSKTFEEFRDAASHLTASLNILYADKQGNIAYQAVGKIPLRHTDGRWVLWGAEPTQHWQGYIDFLDLPYCLNPPRGYIVSANNQVLDSKLKETEFLLQGYRSNGYRAKQLEMMMDSTPKVSYKDLQTFFFNNNSTMFTGWIATLRKELDDTDGFTSKELEAKNLLDNWNGEFDVSRPEPSIAALFVQNLYELTIRTRGVHYFSINALDNLITNHELDDWWWTPKDGNLETDNPKNEITIRAFKKSVSELVEKYGENIGEWKWGRLHYINLVSPFPVLDKLSPGKVPSPGGVDTINQGIYSFDRTDLTFPQYFGTSLRMLIDLQAPEQLVYMNIPGGQNSNPVNHNSHDQIELWKSGKLKNLIIN